MAVTGAAKERTETPRVARTRLETVEVGERSLAAYFNVAPVHVLEALDREAERLRGARILQLNATPYGGGVSELLRSGVPLLADLGLDVEWHVITGDEPFFRVTKAIHNGLQGDERELAQAERDAYLATSARNAELLGDHWDFIVVHDPQPAAILPLRGKGDAKWVWRCHIETTAPNPSTWDFLRGFLCDYDAAVFTLDEFIPPDLPIDRVAIVPPAIDPLSPKNLPLARITARQVLDWIGVRLDAPLVTQVSRFDPWKDPLGVIDAYRLAREEVPDLQLALVGSMALDDPEGWDLYREIQAKAAGDTAIRLFTNLSGVGNIEVNAFQRLSSVVLQKSIREGFGLVISESLWKGTPVVAGRAGGIPLQMADGAGGVLVDSTEEAAAAMVELLRDPDRGDELGRTGRERVHEHFLLPRLLLNELVLLNAIAGNASRDVQVVQDPVCGLVLDPDRDGPALEQHGERLRFCSDDCRRHYLTKGIPAAAREREV
ncbi:MAG TPA: glycosyltransferase [Gaiellaceae bacterium]|nr:glycosyltransferase [Gaiellaceae bacterium]